jgi:hypothetical protein
VYLIQNAASRFSRSLYGVTAQLTTNKLELLRMTIKSMLAYQNSFILQQLKCFQLKGYKGLN